MRQLDISHVCGIFGVGDTYKTKEGQNESKTNTGNHSCTRHALYAKGSERIRMENKHRKQKLLMKRLVPRNRDSTAKRQKKETRRSKEDLTRERYQQTVYKILGCAAVPGTRWSQPYIKKSRPFLPILIL